MSGGNLDLWDSVRTPDPTYTKQFKKGGGFSGTAINAVYLIRCATELWGPMGGKWGVRVIDERVYDGAPMFGSGDQVVGYEKLHVVRIELYHPHGVVPAFGHTIMVGQNKNGPFTDEEAPKKSLTDAVSKALSWIGFGADVHMGHWDDNRYVNDAREAFRGERVRVVRGRPSAANGADEAPEGAVNEGAGNVLTPDHLRAALRAAAQCGLQALEQEFSRLRATNAPGLALLWRAEGASFKEIAAKADASHAKEAA